MPAAQLRVEKQGLRLLPSLLELAGTALADRAADQAAERGSAPDRQLRPQPLDQLLRRQMCGAAAQLGDGGPEAVPSTCSSSTVSR